MHPPSPPSGKYFMYPLLYTIHEVPTRFRSKWPLTEKKPSPVLDATFQSQNERFYPGQLVTLSGAEWQSKSLTSISANFATLSSMSSLAFSLLPFSFNCTENCYCANSYTIDTFARASHGSEKGLAISELPRASVSSVQPLIWKWFFILMQIKLIFTRKVLHLASFWKWGILELGRGLFLQSTFSKSFILHSNILYSTGTAYVSDFERGVEILTAMFSRLMKSVMFHR